MPASAPAHPSATHHWSSDIGPWSFRGLLAAAALLVLSPLALRGAEVLLDETDYPAFAVGGEGAERVRAQPVAVEGPGFSRALRIETLAGGASFPSVAAVMRHAGTLAQGESLLMRFHLRTLASPKESGEGWTQFEVQNNRTFAISGQFAAHAASAWREFLVPVRMVRDCPPGQASVNFRVGDRAQVVEIGGLRVERKGPGVPLSSLPATPVLPSYEGMEPDAPWRAEARERIERHRKAGLRIEVRDADGRPLPGVRLRVRQLGHAYRFGAAVRADVIAAEGEAATRYRAEILRLFSAVTFENDLKWGRWLADRDTPQKAARWLEANRLALRGHTMVWPTYRLLPAPLAHLKDDPEALRRAVEAHIADIGRALSPRVAAWDVINEPFRNHDFMDALGEDVMADWFRAASASAPDARLYLNDFGIITGGGMDEKHQAGYERTARRLLASGAPLQGLGFQGHFERILTSPPRLLALLDRFGELGLPMELTEYSTQIPDADFNAAYLRDTLTAFFSHPLTEGFIVWSFKAGSGYRHGAVLLDREGRLTPAGRAWTDLVFREWWTDATAETDATGSASLRVFKGHYIVEAVSPAAPRAWPVAVLADGEPLRLTLDDAEPAP